MKHSVRQKIINQYGLPVVKVETIHGELGSDILDKNALEIFEGDKVKINKGIYYVVFRSGTFVVCDANGCAIFSLRELDNCDIEVVA